MGVWHGNVNMTVKMCILAPAHPSATGTGRVSGFVICLIARACFYVCFACLNVFSVFFLLLFLFLGVRGSYQKLRKLGLQGLWMNPRKEEGKRKNEIKRSAIIGFWFT